ncbi:MAG: peptidoglycan DD-metalloendopeptidase family protein [Leptolyngbya sp. SIO4C5]|nr:peptidoglycan DD-metalloendopeptidase family protein [Leptolyngbya sp. SIO4C5]
MIGLALSMGASGALLPRQDHATAADVPAAKLSTPTTPLALRIASIPGLSAAVAMAAPQATAYHTVAAGQTLWQIAQIHGVNVETIESANGVTQDTVLQVGQVLRVPANEASSSAPTTLEIALAGEAPQLSQAQVLSAAAEQDEQFKVQQEASLQNLNQKRDELSSALTQVESEVQPVSEIRVQTGEPIVAKFSSESAASAEASTSGEEIAKHPGRLESVSSVIEAAEPDMALPAVIAEDEAERLSVSPSLPLPAEVESQASDRSAENLSEPTADPLAAIPTQPSSVDLEAFSETTPETTSAVSAVTDELPVPVAIMPTAAQTYEVRSGDTVASIAESYDISATELARFNGIADPNFIVAGSVLAVPQGSLNTSSDLTAAVPSVFQPEATTTDEAEPRLARLQATVVRRVDPAEVLGKLQRQPSVAEVAAAAATTETTAAATAELTTELAVETSDPYVSNLLADVEATRQLQAVPESPQPETTEVALGGVESPTRAVVPLNPEFSTQTTEPEASSFPSSLPQAEQAQLFAAAPLGSEAYAPINPTPTGRVVSPAMPALPAADEFLPEAPNHFNGYAWPTTGVLTSGYGWRWGRMHRGVDVAGPVGTPIMAAAPGVVERSGWNSGGYGNLVEIRHPDGSMTRYAHNSRLIVAAGQQVAQGQQIAEMGSTGYSTGPHLHFEIHLPGQGTVNPMAYLPNR